MQSDTISIATDWNDLYVRTGLGEAGPNPDQRVGGVNSPDICPVGTKPPVDAWDLVTPQSYNTYITSSFYQGLPNFIYVRCRNSSSERQKGVAYLVMSDPAVVIWPGGDAWTRVYTQSQSLASPIVAKGDASGVPGGALGLTYDDPFVLDPKESGHRCLVTWLSTEDHPMPDVPPKITTMADLAIFLKDHPNYAHHNIDIVPNTTGIVTKAYPFSSGDQAGKWVIGVKVVNGKGYKVSCNSAKPLPDGKYIDLPPTEVKTNEAYALTLDYTIPGDFNTYINLTYDPQGLTTPDFAISLVAYLHSTKGDEFYEFATPFSELGVDSEAAHFMDRGILLGSMTLLTR